MRAVDQLGSPALMPLWKAVHDRLSSGRQVTRVKAGPLDEEQRSAVADLLGTDRLPGEYATVSMAALDELLMSAVGAGAREVAVALLGPLGDRAGERALADVSRSELWTWLDSHVVVTAQPALKGWVDSVRRAGLVAGSVERTRNELDRALRVLAALPAAGVPLPVLAENLLGDPHALDEGTRSAGLVLRALAELHDVELPGNAQERRALWESVGVVEDELSSVVLAAGLRLSGVGGQVLRVCADEGHVAALTLAQLRATSFAGAPQEVWVFENPSVLAVAVARLGPSCPPMVCTSGWPNSAVIALLRGLAAEGSTLRYHGDFDGEGVRIAAHVIARTGAKPWRMATEDYLGALGDGTPVGRVTEAPWDDGLATAMREHGSAVPEERVTSHLLDEIERRGRAVGGLP
ncbi:TIGR02679 family protein [Lentzea sp. HUAS12]|uniref:TIGR02679 family protein n=1 Tax=Lentzea sp. HUAS12 TaxID=2951806 RepID=UPI00209E2D00|nr:TIGR02679 family protein [Lentzea sp. HUAS12]USX52300.1 TIGR02679 family protein [Lentzea sp. HUAS12]